MQQIPVQRGDTELLPKVPDEAYTYFISVFNVLFLPLTI